MVKVVRVLFSVLFLFTISPFVSVALAVGATTVEVPFESFEELRVSKVLRPGTRYVVKGHLHSEDGAGGVFLFQTAKPSPETPGITYEVKGRGYLLRQAFDRNSPVRAEWFGARGDGKSDDRDGIQAALDAHHRVDLMSKHYGIGKGLYVGWCNRGTPQSAKWEKCIGQRGSVAIVVKSGYRILGSGRDVTKLRLLDGTNPRLNLPDGGVFQLIGNTLDSSAANVVVRDLSIDVNFDGQSKAERAPSDSLRDSATGEVLTAPNPGEVATINAISVWGPNALFENLRVVGYSSNTFHEAFVVSSWLKFKDSSVGRECGTIRNVEMTSPGSNLEIKYRRNNPYAAEITHISVAGAHNFTNQPYGYGTYSIPRSSPDWSLDKRQRFSTMTEALARLSAESPPKVVEILTPGVVTYAYNPQSELPANNLTVFAPHKSTVDLPSGRLIRQATKMPADYSVKSEGALRELVQGLTPAQRDNKMFAVETPSVEFYRVDKAIPGLEGDSVRIFTTENGALALTRIQGPDGGCGSGWGCDPAFDPSHLGENAANTWACEGGVIENVHIHDEVTNPQGYDSTGRAYGLSGEEVKRTNGSHLHGISVALTNNMVIRQNRVENFMGPAVFMMSWWNKNLVVRDNYFDRVLTGVLLLSMVENPGVSTRPFQFPRFQNIAIANNYIRLIEKTNTYRPAAFQIQDQSTGAAFTDPQTRESAMSEEQYPRFENIRFAYNRVVGRAVIHADKKTTLYPVGVDVTSKSYLRNIRVWRNSFDITPNPTLSKIQNGSAIQIKPGHFYQSRDEKRHSFAIFENTDLQGDSAEKFGDELRDLSKRANPPATTAYPVLLKLDDSLLEVGDERS